VSKEFSGTQHKRRKYQACHNGELPLDEFEL